MRDVFIDCGGYDGCSVIKFLQDNVKFECVTFEPNEELHGYYRFLPTKLVKKAAFTYDGKIEITIDDDDADGSSVVPLKNVYYNNPGDRKKAPKKTIDCLDLGKFIMSNYSINDNIILKIDIEGAEYQLLENMHSDGSLEYVNKIMAEFHWEKIGLPEEEHKKIIDKLAGALDVDEWDALSFSVHKKSLRKKIKRLLFIGKIYFMKMKS